jgi:hypothetical protein
MSAVRSEPHFVCMSCGQLFAESRASGFKCDRCHERDQRRKLMAIERRVAEQRAGLVKTLGHGWAGR